MKSLLSPHSDIALAFFKDDGTDIVLYCLACGETLDEDESSPVFDIDGPIDDTCAQCGKTVFIPIFHHSKIANATTDELLKRMRELVLGLQKQSLSDDVDAARETDAIGQELIGRGILK